MKLPGCLEWLAVFVFGTLGTILRLILSAESVKPEAAFGSVSSYWVPNVIGSAVIAFANGVGNGSSMWSKILHRGVVVGFCGGLTTFSSYVFEAVRRKNNSVSDMIEDLVLTICGALGAYYFGWHLAMVVKFKWNELLASSPGRVVPPAIILRTPQYPPTPKL